MQRRLNIIASLLHRLQLLPCDEPTVGVDPQSRNAIFEFLEKLNREGLAGIYSTHCMEEATRLSKGVRGEGSKGLPSVEFFLSGRGESRVYLRDDDGTL